MYRTACVVNVRSRNKHGTCCGLLLDSNLGLVLAHASCLSPFVEQGHFDLDSTSFTLGDLKSFDCDVLLQRVAEERDLASSRTERLRQVGVSTEADDSRVLREKNDRLHGTVISSFKELSRSKSLHAYSKFSSRAVEFFQCRKVAEALEKLMPEPSWELGDRKDGSRGQEASHSSKSRTENSQLQQDYSKLLSSFIILQIDNWLPYSSTTVIRPTTECHLGDRVEICSTPFGGLKPNAFLNSYSRGIISNLAGKDNCLLLSDARCILGGEGAPLYTFQQNGTVTRCLTGVIIASLSWKNDEWVGFCVACDIGAVVQSLPQRYARLQRCLEPTPSGSLLQGSALPQGVLGPEVALLQVGPTWGSGVVVSQEKGIILTCSHVIKEAHLRPVCAKRTQRHTEMQVNILYRQHPLKGQFDLALVECRQWQRPSLGSFGPVAIGNPAEGLEVYVIGHALFGSEHNLQPSITSGVISKIISVNKIPVMIQTTCAVHPGASGGALVDTRGRLLGIVVCNAKDNTTGASFPHINMSIPVSTVWPVIEEYMKGQDVQCLEALAVKNRLLDKIWSLGATQDTALSQVTSKL